MILYQQDSERLRKQCGKPDRHKRLYYTVVVNAMCAHVYPDAGIALACICAHRRSMTPARLDFMDNP